MVYTSVIVANANMGNGSCMIPYNLGSLMSKEPFSWNMSFCYEDQCVSKNNEVISCAKGKHSLRSASVVDWTHRLRGRRRW